eukprot:6174930-Pleurochrysis_carterae.AAC.1
MCAVSQSHIFFQGVDFAALEQKRALAPPHAKMAAERSQLLATAFEHSVRMVEAAGAVPPVAGNGFNAAEHYARSGDAKGENAPAPGAAPIDLFLSW